VTGSVQLDSFVSDRAVAPGDRYVCIHGHFYQPPRENPWLEAVEVQDSAYPYHDWNERITAECYAPNAASRIFDGAGHIAAIVNNYARISFNFGPTLLTWMETRAPGTYRALLEADRASQQSFSGHGSALAQAYNHMILPLANSRDKRTQVLWGVRDFRHRFGRHPEGMWLSETAVDLETLEFLADFGIQFTVLAPHQARQVRPLGGDRWENVEGGRVDPSMPYQLRLPSGRTIILFFYDGPISRSIAFDGLLASGERFAHRLRECFSDTRGRPQLVHVATDGETYGHHHAFGDMGLAAALDHLEATGAARVTNYGEFLALHPPTHEVEIIENSSWSCIHGIERWRSNCGCNSGGHGSWNQEWRGPLRAALDFLRDAVAPLYEERAGALLRDPWAARDDYVGVVLDRSTANVDAFLARHARHDLSEAEQVMVLQLLELQRHAMLMYTSCGWFFDELTGIETVQVIQYAGRVVQLARAVFDDDLESEFLARLGTAKSNIPEHQDGAHIYAKWVRPSMVDLHAVGAHYAISSLFEAYGQQTRVHCYDVVQEQQQTIQSGREKLAVGRARITSAITRESATLSFAALAFGAHHVGGGGRFVASDSGPCPRAREMIDATVAQEIVDAFTGSDLPRVLRLIDRHFGSDSYSLTSLFRDEQRKVLAPMVESVLEGVETLNRQVYEHATPIMRLLEDLGLARPSTLLAAAGLTLNAELRRALGDDQLDAARVRALLADAEARGVLLDAAGLEHALQTTVDRLVEQLCGAPAVPAPLHRLKTAVEVAGWAPFRVNLWRAQNVYWELLHTVYPGMRRSIELGDEAARAWRESFLLLGERLGISAHAMLRAGGHLDSAVAMAEAILASAPLGPLAGDSLGSGTPGAPALVTSLAPAS
jgi:alpha-amylase/alpha-mannosidase (GH57 family)